MDSTANPKAQSSAHKMSMLFKGTCFGLMMALSAHMIVMKVQAADSCQVLKKSMGLVFSSLNLLSILCFLILISKNIPNLVVQSMQNVARTQDLSEMACCEFMVRIIMLHTAILPVISKTFSVFLNIDPKPMIQWITNVVSAARKSGLFIG